MIRTSCDPNFLKTALKNNDTTSGLCALNTPKVYTQTGEPRVHPLYDPFLVKDAWNERSWHSARKALQAARIADNAVREAYRYLDWTRQQGESVRMWTRKAVAAVEEEIPGSRDDDLLWKARGMGEIPAHVSPLLDEFQGRVKSPHWF